MLKWIISFIGSALCAIGRGLARVISWPGRLLGTARPAPTENWPELVELQRQVDNSEAIADAAEKMAGIVSNWAMDSVIVGQPVPEPRPPRVSRDVSNWLPGLSRIEALLLVGSTPQAVSAHIQRKSLISGVRPVQKLTPEPWPVEKMEAWVDRSGELAWHLNAAPAPSP